MPTTMDSKGRITLPGWVVEALGLVPGGIVDFVVNGDGEIVVRNVSASSCCIPDRFDAARGKADVPWQTRELMAFLRGGDCEAGSSGNVDVAKAIAELREARRGVSVGEGDTSDLITNGRR